jgi:hypothetical protein
LVVWLGELPEGVVELEREVVVDEEGLEPRRHLHQRKQRPLVELAAAGQVEAVEVGQARTGERRVGARVGCGLLAQLLLLLGLEGHERVAVDGAVGQVQLTQQAAVPHNL